MNLGFSQKWEDGSSTYFIEKIWLSFLLDDKNWADYVDTYNQYQEKHYEKFNKYFDASLTEAIAPKIHTIRPGHRWKTGDKIHMVINNRQKNRFQFAPMLEVKSVQDFEVVYFGKYVRLFIDGEQIDIIKIMDLATNDGFKDYISFVMYFKEFKGQIVHWTNHRYNL